MDVLERGFEDAIAVLDSLRDIGKDFEQQMG